MDTKQMDTVREVKADLQNLIGAMAVIYEGLTVGDMPEQSPDCILVLEKALANTMSKLDDVLKEVL